MFVSKSLYSVCKVVSGKFKWLPKVSALHAARSRDLSRRQDNRSMARLTRRSLNTLYNKGWGANQLFENAGKIESLTRAGHRIYFEVVKPLVDYRQEAICLA